MTTEQRAQRDYVRKQLRDLEWAKQSTGDIPEPIDVKAARKLVDRFEDRRRRAWERYSKKYEAKLEPIRQNIAFGNYTLALGLIKKFKAPKGVKGC